MRSATKKKLDTKRGHLNGLMALLRFISAFLWSKIADIDIAEGRKFEASLSLMLCYSNLVLGWMNLREFKANK